MLYRKKFWDSVVTRRDEMISTRVSNWREDFSSRLDGYKYIEIHFSYRSVQFWNEFVKRDETLTLLVSSRVTFRECFCMKYLNSILNSILKTFKKTIQKCRKYFQLLYRDRGEKKHANWKWRTLHPHQFYLHRKRGSWIIPVSTWHFDGMT